MRIGQLALRLGVVTVLVLGIVVMHHVAKPSHDGSAPHDVSAATDHAMVVSGESSSVPAEDDSPSAGHDLLHLCLAVMSAAAMLLFGWLLLVRRPWLSASAFAAFQARPMPTRSPPRPHGSALLMSLCVLRT